MPKRSWFLILTKAKFAVFPLPKNLHHLCIFQEVPSEENIEGGGGDTVHPHRPGVVDVLFLVSAHKGKPYQEKQDHGKHGGQKAEQGRFLISPQEKPSKANPG